MLYNIVESEVRISGKPKTAAYLSLHKTKPSCPYPLVLIYLDCPPPIFYIDLHHNISLAHCSADYKDDFPPILK